MQVYDEVKDVRAKWYFFCLALGLGANELDSIDSACNSKPDKCLMEALKKFLSKGKPTWKALADALGNESIGFGMLAEQVRENHP